MSNSAIEILTDKIDELTQQNKRYQSSLEYLARIARDELQKEDNNIEVEILALEIIKVFESVNNYKFTL